MSEDLLLDAVGKIPFSQPLRDDQNRELAAIGQLAEFEANEKIFGEWKLAQHLYLIVEGSVELRSRKVADRRIGRLSAGELFGWSAIFQPERYLTATAVAVTPTRVVIFERQALLALMERDHELGYRLMSHVAKLLAERLYHVFVQFNSPDDVEQ